jgi:3-oxoacyl-(acyl-carrier-protein) synthase
VHTKCFENAGVGAATEIDTINRHLTATTKDSLEIQNGVKPWAEKVKSSPINSLKSMVGHCLSGAGGMKA